MTNFNERTNTLLYKNIISHTLFSKRMTFHVCERWVETRRDCNIDPSVLLSHPGWVAQPWVTECPKPSVCRWLSIRHLVSNWLKPYVCWLYYCLTSTCFRCSSAYLHMCISWLTARSRVHMLHTMFIKYSQEFRSTVSNWKNPNKTSLWGRSNSWAQYRQILQKARPNTGYRN